MIAGLFILLVGITLVAFILGNLITEKNLLPKFINIKPFNCRKCLTTHLIWVPGVFIGLLIENMWFVVMSIIFAAIAYFLLDREDKKQFY